MKKIFLALIVIFALVLYKLPSLHKAYNFKSYKEALNIVPVDHSLDPARDFVVITDEIPIFKKYLVEAPIDLDLAENSPETVKLTSEDDTERMVIFNYKNGSDKVNKDVFYNYEKLKDILNTTYDTYEVGDQKKSMFDFFFHSKLLLLKKSLINGKEILSLKSPSKRGFIMVGGEDQCTSALVYIDGDVIDISFCKVSTGERDYILNSLQADIIN